MTGGYWMGRELPGSAIVEEEVEVIGCLLELDEVDDVIVVDVLPVIDLFLEFWDKVIIVLWLLLGVADVIKKLFLGDHLAGQLLAVVGVNCQIDRGESALAQFAVLDGVVSIYYL
jgi:hypothetical protein